MYTATGIVRPSNVQLNDFKFNPRNANQQINFYAITKLFTAIYNWNIKPVTNTTFSNSKEIIELRFLLTRKIIKCGYRYQIVNDRHSLLNFLLFLFFLFNFGGFCFESAFAATALSLTWRTFFFSIFFIHCLFLYFTVLLLLLLLFLLLLMCKFLKEKKKTKQGQMQLCEFVVGVMRILLLLCPTACM